MRAEKSALLWALVKGLVNPAYFVSSENSFSMLHSALQLYLWAPRWAILAFTGRDSHSCSDTVQLTLDGSQNGANKPLSAVSNVSLLKSCSHEIRWRWRVRQGNCFPYAAGEIYRELDYLVPLFQLQGRVAEQKKGFCVPGLALNEVS